MKKDIIITLTILAASLFSVAAYAQEKHGSTLNLGLGIGGYSGYYKYAGHSLPVININYEFDVARSFTLAPFVSLYTFSDNYYWGDNNNPSRYYKYRETVIPIGLKGTYYFDDLLDASDDWDFYLGASLGLAIVNSHWEQGYLGNRNYYHGGSSVFVDFHLGAEYHINNHLGVFLDLSSGASTLGLAFHGN
jgi:hypothetical protein